MMHFYSYFYNVTKHQPIQAFICQYRICTWTKGLKKGAHLREEEVAVAIVMMAPHLLKEDLDEAMTEPMLTTLGEEEEEFPC